MKEKIGNKLAASLASAHGYALGTTYCDGGQEYWDGYGGPIPEGWTKRPYSYYISARGEVLVGGIFGDTVGFIEIE